jgi:serine/threonine-protein kinase
VHKRILFGVAAWLLGAATATAGSLLAVSLLGQGIGGNSAQQLTQDAVNRALASEVAESTPSARPAPTRTAHPAAKRSRPTATARPTSPPSNPTADPSPPPSGGADPSPAPTGGAGTVLTSKGGEVVASCQPAGAYLLSWSPAQGYSAGNVHRGPAAVARVTFETAANEVTMTVTCSAGVPTARSSVDSGP